MPETITKLLECINPVVHKNFYLLLFTYQKQLLVFVKCAVSR